MNGDSGTRAEPVQIWTPNPSEVAAARAPAADDSLTISSDALAHALRRKWHVAVPLALAVAAVVGLAVSARVPPAYVARTLVHVPPVRPAILYGDADTRRDSVNFQRTQVAMVKSRFVLERAAQELAPRNLELLRGEPEPVDWLASRITADFVVAPEILQIKLKEASPEEMVVILDAVRDTYVREVLNRDRDEYDTRMKQLADLAASHGAKLAEQRRLLASRAEALGVRDPSALRQQFEQGRTRIAALTWELSYVRASIRQLEFADERLVAPAPPDPDLVAEMTDRVMAADDVAAARRQEAAALESKLADHHLYLRNFESTPTYQALTTALAQTRNAIADRRRELQPVAEARVKSSASRQQAQEQALRRQIRAAARQSLPQLESEVLDQEQASARLARGLGEIETLQKTIAREEEQAQFIDSRIRALQVEQNAPPRARLLEPSAIAETPPWRQYVRMAVVPLIGAVAVVVLLGWLDLRGGRVNGPADLAACHLRVLGAVPAVREHVLQTFGAPRLGRSRAEFRQLSNALDIAREMILPNLPCSGGFVLAVTSAEPGEGKTVLAAHLAVRLALSGRRTLLIESDVRTPRLHALFGVPSHPGLVSLLGGEADLAGVARPGPVPGLNVIPSGGSGPDSLAGMPAGRIPELLDNLRPQYDVIVVDTASVRLASETLILSRAADGVLLSVLRDVSRLREVLANYDRLASVNARVLGVVFSGERAPRNVR
ncbi:hypothetical protein J0H58_14450 [bacterium]|nr:hypothetical protein [bacterium]